MTWRSAAVSWLDVKLGLRMLVKQPGLTFVAMLALSIGIPAALVPVHVLDALTRPLPFDEGERIVGIVTRDVSENRDEPRSLHDFFMWREELRSYEALAAARSDPWNVISEDGRAEPVRGAEITAAAFDILRVPPLMGRTLRESDEIPGAPDVVVLGWETWQGRLGGDPDVVGRTIRVGTVPHEIVGVMPEGFMFPMRDHLWLPLRDRPTQYERGTGPDILVFARLKDRVSIEEAQAELSTVGARMAAEFPDTHRLLRPSVMGFTAMITGLDSDARFGMYITQLVVIVLLGVVCGNVGTLILARTATRSGEIALRTALGASRSRIVSQLFVESLVLAVLSAGAGLLLGDAFANAFARRVFLETPFWFDLGVGPKTAAIALSLAAFCAVVAGVVPALKATGGGVQRNLQRAGTGPGGAGGIRFGAGASALIVAEVALAIGFMTLGGATAREALTRGSVESAVDREEYLMALVRVPWTDHAAVENDLRVDDFRLHVAATHEALARRLAAEPGVRGVAMASVLPGMPHPERRVEVEGIHPAASDAGGDDFRGIPVMGATVDVGFFAGLGQPILNGRDFTSADLAGDPDVDRTAVIVNTAFVEHVLGGRNPIGRRLRYVVPEGREPGPWYEIVGVVGHLGMNERNPLRDEGVYHPAAPGEIHPVLTAVRVGGDPMAFLPRLRQVTAEVDPDAMIQYPSTLADAPNGDRQINTYVSILMLALAGITLMLSAAGLYALMSFTVAQRTREIGIRVALGANPGGIVGVIARRAVAQLLAGVVAGVGLGTLLVHALEGESATAGGDWVGLLAVLAAFMFAVGVAACVVPTLRGLRIRPVEALRSG